MAEKEKKRKKNNNVSAMQEFTLSLGLYASCSNFVGVPSVPSEVPSD